MTTSSSRTPRLWIAVVVRAVVALVLLIIGFSVFGFLAGSKPEPKRVDRSAELPLTPVMPIQMIDVNRQWVGFGTARARFAADVPARVTATIERLGAGMVDGASIRTGDLIADLDGVDFERQAGIARETIRDLDAQLERLDVEEASWTRRFELASEAVALVQAEYERVAAAQARGAAQPREVDLARQSVIQSIRDETTTREELDKIAPRRLSLRAQRSAQEESLRLSELNVERSSVRCPSFGRAEEAGYPVMLQTLDVEVGENVVAGQRIARVVDPAVVEIVLRLPTSARSDIRIGDTVDLVATGDRPQRWTSRVARIAPENDERTRTMAVFVEVTQDGSAPDRLAPGQYVRGEVTSRSTIRTTPIPRRSVDRDHVLLVRDGVIALHRIVIADQLVRDIPELGVADSLWIVPETPLPDDAQIVIVPTRRLTSGVRIEPTLPGASNAEAPE